MIILLSVLFLILLVALLAAVWVYVTKLAEAREAETDERIIQLVPIREPIVDFGAMEGAFAMGADEQEPSSISVRAKRFVAQIPEIIKIEEWFSSLSKEVRQQAQVSLAAEFIKHTRQMMVQEFEAMEKSQFLYLQKSLKDQRRGLTADMPEVIGELISILEGVQRLLMEQVPKLDHGFDEVVKEIIGVLLLDYVRMMEDLYDGKVDMERFKQAIQKMIDAKPPVPPPAPQSVQSPPPSPEPSWIDEVENDVTGANGRTRHG